MNDIDDKRRQLRLMRELVDEGVSILGGGQDLGGFGELLHEAWQAKRSLSAKVSNSTWTTSTTRPGRPGPSAASSSGPAAAASSCFFAPPERHAAIRERLAKLIHVPFKFEFGGSQIIFFDREEDYSAEEQARSARTIDAFRELGH